MPKTISASEVKNKLGSVVRWVLQNQDEVIVESHGAPTVVIMSYAHYETIKGLQEQTRRHQALQRLRALGQSVGARNQDLTAEEGDALATRFAREFVADLVKDGKVQFEE